MEQWVTLHRGSFSDDHIRRGDVFGATIDNSPYVEGMVHCRGFFSSPTISFECVDHAKARTIVSEVEIRTVEKGDNSDKMKPSAIFLDCECSGLLCSVLKCSGWRKWEQHNSAECYIYVIVYGSSQLQSFANICLVKHVQILSILSMNILKDILNWQYNLTWVVKFGIITLSNSDIIIKY